MTNTVNGLKVAIGQTVGVFFDTLIFSCRIIDVKVSWGKQRLLIEPSPGAGIGRQWIELSRVSSILESRPYQDARETTPTPTALDRQL